MPSILVIDKKIKELTPYRLRDFVKYIASGSTPLKSESDKYYSDKDNGISFIRVQNLNQSGILSFEDVKYINIKTHKGLLKRSQVRSGDLLIKITGVGRMAVTSVVPDNFKGNINQHIALIRTLNKHTSELIAAFLNTDIGEKLATRRSTGGTRPALDYSALLSIPIILDERILNLSKEIYQKSENNESQATEILSKIDEYLLEKLGITPPTAETDLKSRIFYTNACISSGNRLDPLYHKKEFLDLEKSLQNGKYPVQNLGNMIQYINYGASLKNEYVDSGIPFLRITDIFPNEVNIRKLVYLPESSRRDIGNAFIQKGDFLITRSGTIGTVILADESIEGFAFGSFMIKFSLKKDAIIDSEYLQYFLNSEICKKIIVREKIGAIQGNITIPSIKGFPIPLPPLSIQQEIAKAIREMRTQAKVLQTSVSEQMEQTKQEIERIIMGEIAN